MTSDLIRQAAAVSTAIEDDVLSMGTEGLTVVKAPPGAGKTYLLLQLLEKLHRSKRIAVACFTNAQADDICTRCAKDHPKIRVIRYLSNSARDVVDGVEIARSGDELPYGPSVVVANTTKWALSKNPEFDYLLVDEAWQISFSDLLLLRKLAPRIVLIGDPGQIPPVVSIETSRWETATAAPHLPAPDQLLKGDVAQGLHALPGSRRLPADSVDLVRHFYDFDFGAFAEPGERFIRASVGKSAEGMAIARLADRSISSLLLPTDDSGPPLEVDDGIAKAIAILIGSLLEGDAKFRKDDGKPQDLKAEHIGVVATHRSMNTRIQMHLPNKLRSIIKVDTTERWQGLERPMMIAVHPLSNTISPSRFDLETGRLCVMASRHQSGLIIVSRDHITDTLNSHIPHADQPLGQPDVVGQGLHRHTAFWSGIG
jgi:hypothetical protein